MVTVVFRKFPPQAPGLQRSKWAAWEVQPSSVGELGAWVLEEAAVGCYLVSYSSTDSLAVEWYFPLCHFHPAFQVYQIYAKRSPEDVYALLRSFGADYVILEDSICYERRHQRGCRLRDLLDIANGHVSMSPRPVRDSWGEGQSDSLYVRE